MSSYRRGGPDVPDTVLDTASFQKLLNETDSSIRGLESRVQSARNDIVKRQVRQKLPPVQANLSTLQGTLDVWGNSLRKFNLTENDYQSYNNRYQDVYRSFTRLQQNVDRQAMSDNPKTALLSGYAPSRPAEDNEETQYMSNQQLLEEEVLRAQQEDAALDSISHGLTQLSFVAKAQNKQMLKQETLVAELREGMERTDQHLQENMLRANIVEKKTRGGCCAMIIMGLLLALIVSVIASNWMCHILPNVKKNKC